MSPGTSVGKNNSFSGRLAEEIEQLIIDNDLQVGDRLPSERELTQTFSVSRSVVRDAIATLEERGVVRSQPGSGLFVEDGTQRAIAQILEGMLRRQAVSLLEVMEVRAIIEVQNAVLAAQRWKEPMLDDAQAALQQMRSAESPTAFVQADEAFHEAIGAAAQNRVAMTMLSSLRSLLLEGMLIGTAVRGARKKAIHDHETILEAVSIRDSDRAAHLMGAHLRRGYEEWIEAGFIESTDRHIHGVP